MSDSTKKKSAVTPAKVFVPLNHNPADLFADDGSQEKLFQIGAFYVLQRPGEANYNAALLNPFAYEDSSDWGTILAHAANTVLESEKADGMSESDLKQLREELVRKFEASLGAEMLERSGFLDDKKDLN